MNECLFQVIEAISLVELIFLQEFKQRFEVLLVQIEVVEHWADVIEHFEIAVVQYTLNIIHFLI